MTRMLIRNRIAGKVKTGGKENVARAATVGKAGSEAATAGRKTAVKAIGAIEFAPDG
jgi:hypothetical protein